MDPGSARRTMVVHRRLLGSWDGRYDKRQVRRPMASLQGKAKHGEGEWRFEHRVTAMRTRRCHARKASRAEGGLTGRQKGEGGYHQMRVRAGASHVAG